MCWAISATEAFGERGAAVVVVVEDEVVDVDVVLGVETAAAALGEEACWRFGAILSVPFYLFGCEGYLMGLQFN